MKRDHAHMIALGALLAAACVLQVVYAQDQYSYNNQGTDWPGTCSSGSQQSPINIQNVQGSCDSQMIINLQFSDQNITSEIVRNQGALYSDGAFSTLLATDINGQLQAYTAQYMLLRVPAEHQIDGKTYSAELQIAHSMQINNQDNQPERTSAIVSIFFDVASTAGPNSFFDQWSPNTLNAAVSVNMKQAFNSTFDPLQMYYTYQGSFSYPPCNETVNWYIYAAPMSISSTVEYKLRSYFSGEPTFAGGNGGNRALQNLNGRTIKQGNIECQEQFIYFFTFFIIYIFLNFFVFKML